jgi:asparaginyl-tRNA synthetase
METLREQAHLRGRTNTFGAVIRVRNALAHATHQFFQQRGFLYIHTPIITASDCEGAGEMFQVTTVLPEPHEPITKAKLLEKSKTPKTEEEIK